MKKILIALCSVSLVLACGSEESSFKDPGAELGSSGGPGGFGGADGGSGGGDGGTGPSGCAKSTKKVEVLPIDMSLLVDTSGSMDYKAASTDVTSKWVNVRNALKSFSSNPAYDDMGVALEFFPRTLTCDVPGYAAPDLAFDTLPNAAVPIFKALDAQGMSGGTPTTQALRGLVQYTRDHATKTAQRKPVVVLATDGVPDASCAGNSVADAMAEAQAAFGGTPSIPVYVIGIGQTGGDEAVMNKIAAAGGTAKAELVTAGSNIESSFLEALNKIRKTAIGCEYPLPAGQTDITQVNVQFSDGSGAPAQGFLYAASAAECTAAGDHGWTVDNAAAPTTVVLCPATCTRVKAAEAGQVDVVFGCPRVDVK
jgi:hypothetical protein